MLGVEESSGSHCRECRSHQLPFFPPSRPWKSETVASSPELRYQSFSEPSFLYISIPRSWLFHLWKSNLFKTPVVNANHRWNFREMGFLDAIPNKHSLQDSSSFLNTTTVIALCLFFALLCACIVIGHLLEEHRWANESITALLLVGCLCFDWFFVGGFCEFDWDDEW